MELEQTKDFNARLGQWIASQGFWFQLRYSMSGSGDVGTAMFHVLKLLFRLAIVLILCSLGGVVYLIKRPASQKFRDDFLATATQGLSASKVKISNIARDQGKFTINKITCAGSDHAFYSKLEARNVSGRMGLTDGVIGKWNLGVVSIFKLDLDLNAGADDASAAASIGKSLFKMSPAVQLTAIDVSDATLHWGYSARTNGSIENSHLNIQRQPDAMKLTFKGGSFSQNWLKRLEIVEMVLNCTPSGITFEKAIFRKGAATVDLSGLKVTGGERPSIGGLAKIRRLPFEEILPGSARSFIEGSLSGDFNVSGSSNSSEGVGFSGQVLLDGQDSLVLRERLPILKAFSDVDYVRNYYRVNFRSGAFQFKTSAGELTLTDVKLKADDDTTLNGQLRVRFPNAEEKKAAQEKDLALQSKAGRENPEAGSRQKTEPAFTLKEAAKALNNTGKSTSAVESSDDVASARLIAEQAADRAAAEMIYEGQFEITLPPDAFELAPKLMEIFPVDPKSGRIPIAIPLSGGLFDITNSQAKEIYQLRSR